MSMKFTTRGIVYDRTDTIYGMLEQGGLTGERTTCSWDRAEKLLAMSRDEIRAAWDQRGSWNECTTLHQYVAFAWYDLFFERTLRRGHTIH